MIKILGKQIPLTIFSRLFFYSIFIVLVFALFYSDTFKTVAAGVAILLFGMIMLEEGFRAFTSGPLTKIVRKSTDRLYKSITLGVISTTLLQSSSLISVITISFISAGFLTLTSGIGIIFGSNIGSTSTAWLVSLFGLKLKISLIAMPMLTIGIILSFQKKVSIRGIGNILAGLGFFFLGIHYMKEGFEVYKTSIDLSAYAMDGYAGVFVYLLIGIVVTVVLQSSGATMALILTALSTDQITFENALALAIGANVGTTITAVLGAVSANVDGKRLAGAHLIFNLITGFIAILFLYPIIDLVNAISHWMNIESTNYTFKVSMFHTVFNIIGVFIMIPMIGVLVKLLIQLIKIKPIRNIERPVFLNEAILNHPQIAYQAIFKETKHLFEGAVFEIVAHAVNIHRQDIISDQKFHDVIIGNQKTIPFNVDDIYYRKVKFIYGQIIQYTTKMNSMYEITPELSKSIIQLRIASRFLVDAVKLSRGLHASVMEHMNSTNEEIVLAYNKLRKRVAKMLRQVYVHHDNEPDDARLKRFEHIKKKSANKDIMIDGSLDRMITNDLISSDMITTLSNDFGIANSIINNIVNVAEQLYINDSVLREHYHDKNIEVFNEDYVPKDLQQ